MGKKLYVGNLSFNTTEESFKGLFAEIGEVASMNFLIDHNTGKSKGFAFIEMANEDDAKTAIEKLNGTEFNGRKIRVNEAYDDYQKANNQRHKRNFRNNYK